MFIVFTVPDMNNPVAEKKRRPWDTPAVKEIQT